MAGTGRKVEVRYGAFGCSIEGYDDPVAELREVLLLMQRMIAETPGLADRAGDLDAVQAARLESALASRGEETGASPGIVVIRRAEAVDAETAEEVEADGRTAAGPDEEPDPAARTPVPEPAFPSPFSAAGDAAEAADAPETAEWPPAREAPQEEPAPAAAMAEAAFSADIAAIAEPEEDGEDAEDAEAGPGNAVREAGEAPAAESAATDNVPRDSAGIPAEGADGRDSGAPEPPAAPRGTDEEACEPDARADPTERPAHEATHPQDTAAGGAGEAPVPAGAVEPPETTLAAGSPDAAADTPADGDLSPEDARPGTAEPERTMPEDDERMSDRPDVDRQRPAAAAREQDGGDSPDAATDTLAAGDLPPEDAGAAAPDRTAPEDAEGGPDTPDVERQRPAAASHRPDSADRSPAPAGDSADGAAPAPVNIFAPPPPPQAREAAPDTASRPPEGVEASGTDDTEGAPAPVADDERVPAGIAGAGDRTGAGSAPADGPARRDPPEAEIPARLGAGERPAAPVNIFAAPRRDAPPESARAPGPAAADPAPRRQAGPEEPDTSRAVGSAPADPGHAAAPAPGAAESGAGGPPPTGAGGADGGAGSPEERPGLAGASRFSALMARLQGAGREPEPEAERGPAPAPAPEPVAGDGGEPASTAAELAAAAGADETTEKLAASAAWLTLVGGRPRFTRREVMEVFETLPGDHARSLEARIKGFGKLVRAGSLVLIGDGVFAIAEGERDRFQALLDQG